jgi:hypothetical protein
MGAKDRLLSPGEIKGLKDAGYDIHDLKSGTGSPAHSDLYETPNGDIVVKPKGGSGEGEPTGININDVGKKTPESDQ